MRPELTVHGTATAIEGPLLFLRRNVEVGLNEAVEVVDEQGAIRLGRVASIDDASMIVEVLESTVGLGLRCVRVRFLGEPIHLSVGPGLLGRVLDGVGKPTDGGPPIMAKRRREHPLSGRRSVRDRALGPRPLPDGGHMDTSEAVETVARSGLDQAAANLREAADARKCWACGCLRQALDTIERA
jgi:hypothetical protein